LQRAQQKTDERFGAETEENHSLIPAKAAGIYYLLQEDPTALTGRNNRRERRKGFYRGDSWKNDKNIGRRDILTWIFHRLPAPYLGDSAKGLENVATHQGFTTRRKTIPA